MRERVAVILTKVRSGAPLESVLTELNCQGWFYQQLDRPTRALILAAHGESQTRQHPPLRERKMASVFFRLPDHLSQAFDALCQRQNVKVSDALVQYIVAQLKADGYRRS